MATFNVLFPILMLFFFTACQVKQGASDAGLISGHVSTTNKFSIVTPATKTFVETEEIFVTVSFPFEIVLDSTGGNPRLRLKIGATTRYADFDSQPESKKLTFKYTVVAGDNDNNGIDVSALELNGSTLQFDKNGTLTNCDVNTLTNKNIPNLKVDTAAPTITAFSLINFPGLYNDGEKINFIMTFSEAVVVTGTPKFEMTIGGNTVDVNYTGGTGSTILAFSYTVSDTDADNNGYDAITSPLDLNGGTIVDIVGNDASLDFSSHVAAAITYSSTVVINGLYPYIIGTAFPADGSYLAAQSLDFTLIFDRDVTVSGTPYLNVVIGANTRQAQYLSGSGTEQITFRYTAVPGDVDANGISVTGSIIRNSGNIVDKLVPTSSFFTDSLNNTFSVPDTSKIFLNALQPQATAVSRNIDSTLPLWGGATADNVWNIGQELNITVSFNTGMYVTQTNGTPTLPLTIGTTTKQATYLSGGDGQTSLVFRYVIEEGDLDTDNTIAIGNISLNGGVITDASNTNTLLTLPVAGLATTKIDGVRPVVSSVTAPTNATYSTVLPYNETTMSFIVTWSEAVNYSSSAVNVAMDIGGTTVNAVYAANNNTTAITHRPSSLATRNDPDGITLNSPLTGTGVIKDQAGNTATVLTYTPPTTSSIFVDTTAPTVTSMTAITANGTYKEGQTLDFSVTFSESVTTVRDTSYPRIPITIGSSTRYLVATASTTNTTHTFQYTIQTGDLDSDGVVVGNAIEHTASYYAQDNGRNNATATFTPPSTPLIKVDAVAPTVSSVTSTTAKTFVSGETISISITYSEPVTVTGTPYIAADFDIGTDNFAYASGSGTATLVFSRTLDGTHFDMNGLASSINTITLDPGELIQDAVGHDAPATFTAQNLSTHFVTYAGVKLWTDYKFASKAPTGSPAISNGGAESSEACGSGTCRSFDGDDSLTLSGSLTGVQTVFIVYKVPVDLGNDENMFTSDIVLDAQTTDYDISTINSEVTYNGTVIMGSPSNHNTSSAFSSTNVIQVDYQSGQNYSAETLIGTTFDGAIGEVIAVEGILTTTQKDNIRNYLDSKY